jgi:hypothetical protein
MQQRHQAAMFQNGARRWQDFDCIKKNKATLTEKCRKGLKTLPPL